jgi:hypothetical protein
MSLKKGYPVRLSNAVIVIGVLCAASAAWADQRVCGEGAVVVKAALGQAVEIVVENGVGDLVRSGDPSTVKVEHTAGHLFLTPLTSSPADVTIIDMQGQSHLIRCVFDQFVDQKIVIGDCVSADENNTRQDAVMALMRDLIRGSAPVGATQKKANAVMFDDGKVRLRVVLIQELPRLLGYVMVVENLTPGPAAVPVQQMSFPGLLAVSSAKDVLVQGEKGDVYMVVNR